MKLISVFYTERQVLEQAKLVTRRLGWATVRVGELLQPIRKGQGLKKGERVVYVGDPVRVVDVRRERLSSITADDVRLEGFPELAPAAFVEMFCRHMGCLPGTVVTRIEWAYTKPRRRKWGKRLTVAVDSSAKRRVRPAPTSSSSSRRGTRTPSRSGSSR